MKMTGVNTTGTGEMQHSEAMHRSHHGEQARQEGIKTEGVDSFQKTEAVNKLKLYDEKGRVVTK